MSHHIETDIRGRRGASARLSGVVLVSTLALVLAGCTTATSTTTANGGSGGSGVDCGSEETQAAITAAVDGRTIKIGYTPPILSEFYTQVEKAAHNRMQELQDCYGVSWEWSRQGALNDAHSGVEAVGIVENFISNGFDAVFVCSAAPHSTMQEIYEQGSEAGVDFYQFNSTEELDNPSQADDPTGGLFTISNIGYDDRWQSGYVAGQYIADLLGGEGQIIQILGPSGSNWTKLRQQGFEAAIGEFPGLTIVGSADGGYVRDKGLTAAQDLLTKFPEVDAIYGENEDMALGASQAIDLAGLKHWDGTDGIITIGADGLISGMDSIREGKLTATVDVNSIEMGTTMINTLFEHEVLGMAVSQFIRIPTVVVDESNVDWAQGRIADALAGNGSY
ncbi:sugar ABC transporter substrate-binding protein [Microbacterium aurantiacum]|uniref:Sugar ABC transporter substrate-binding protein n=1 Tax=Microbacterium aurantiacum TaxID=162393 RepID=A0AAJ2HH11_9MICO|nr:sugar ABC transporter substrate-binding protein [Microbacterium aurantiacum]MDS0244310.1 sugar ABC transporter substrate-binding protein [Microbacterium aurantiacum]